MRHALVVGVSSALLGISLVGCAVDAQGPEQDDEASSEDALRVGLTPGKFLLHEEPSHASDPTCDFYVDLELTSNGRAELANRLTGSCTLVALVHPRDRAYSLRQTGTSCGSKIYSGARRVQLGASKTGIARITITDHRTRRCKDIQPAVLEVEETTPTVDGPVSVTYYSQRESPADALEAAP